MKWIYIGETFVGKNFLQAFRNTLDKSKLCLTEGISKISRDILRNPEERSREGEALSLSGPQRDPLKVLPNIVVASRLSDSGF